MIYFWRGDDGHYAFATDREDRELARLRALEEGMDPSAELGCMTDTAQIAARKAGLMVTPWERGQKPGSPGWEDGLGTVFPFGPFCVPAPLGVADMDAETEHVRRNWQPVSIRHTPECGGAIERVDPGNRVLGWRRLPRDAEGH